MVKKLLFQLLVFVFMALLLWMGLRQINWKGPAALENLPAKAEQKLGELTLAFFMQHNEQVTDAEVLEYLDKKFLTPLFAGNEIEKASIDIYILKNKNVNAMALPGRKIILYTGLINFSEAPESLAGVIAHEMAHVQANHVSKKLQHQLGLSALAALLSGGYSGEVIREVAQVLALNSYSRNLEREADNIAITYLHNAGINPEYFAGFFELYHEDRGSIPQELQWFSTHPVFDERVKLIRESMEELPGLTYKAFDRQKWNAFKNRVKAI